ncbi:MAG: exodeoxyribonuclease VII large subunit, partial [Actinomycetota bacterium]|nr:exodeoxyribonuclease VII large subunit [Actinomycetota bacterium]
MAIETSAERPAPVRQIANALSAWINRLGWVWVEGQIAQLTRRPGTQTVFLTLRDSAADVSLVVTCPRRVFDTVDPPVLEGAQVVVHARPSYYVPRGTLSLTADDVRPVGLGELLARLERRRRLLAAEGLFDRALKRPLPFLPATVGLICGRRSAAERDVLDNSRRRWPGVRFRVENTPVQGPEAAREVIDALRRLDRDRDVEVVVIARGGGSVEDLLPFSDEGLVRAVAACRTPVVSAIGHEQDSPLLDLVADHRASTPTDAAKCVVPDVAEELHQIRQLRERSRQAVTALVER